MEYSISIKLTYDHMFIYYYADLPISSYRKLYNRKFELPNIRIVYRYYLRLILYIVINTEEGEAIFDKGGKWTQENKLFNKSIMKIEVTSIYIDI